MIIYDENLKISAITQNSLEVLGFDSLDDFLSHHSDLGELVITSQKNTNCSFLEFLQNANNNTARINIKRKELEMCFSSSLKNFTILFKVNIRKRINIFF